jgi:hypothetical protein
MSLFPAAARRSSRDRECRKCWNSLGIMGKIEGSDWILRCGLPGDCGGVVRNTTVFAPAVVLERSETLPSSPECRLWLLSASMACFTSVLSIYACACSSAICVSTQFWRWQVAGQ